MFTLAKVDRLRGVEPSSSPDTPYETLDDSESSRIKQKKKSRRKSDGSSKGKLKRKPKPERGRTSQPATLDAETQQWLTGDALENGKQRTKSTGDGGLE